MTNPNNSIFLKVEGMNCANCALGVTSKLSKIGHKEVMVNFATGDVTLEMLANLQRDDVIKTIEDMGFSVVREENKKNKSFNLRQRFWFSLAFTIPLFFGHLFPDHNLWINEPWIQLLLCMPVFIVGLWYFGKSAIGSLKAGIPNMDVLIVIGVISSFGYSLLGMYWLSNTQPIHNYIFFETTATIITLVLLGNYLEFIAVKKTTSAIDELATLQPEKANRIITLDGLETIVEILAAEIKKTDILIIHAGESVPADGIVLSGNGTANESMMTGESLPVNKVIGDKVIGGTILIDGPIRISVRQTGSDTILSNIIALVKKAQLDKPPVQQLTDKIAAIFVPVVLVIALLTFLISHFAFQIDISMALMNSISVLVISCPCAMGLATPTAVMVGIGRAAKNGILIRGGRTLETLAQIKTIVFDKTGTLTTGNFSTIQLSLFENQNEKRIKEIHILKKENILAATGFQNFREQKGIGIHATDEDGIRWSLGSWRILPESQNIEYDIYLLKNGICVAAVTLEDELRAGMKELVDFLHSKNIHTVLLSGDQDSKCLDIAHKIGIQEVFSQQLPEHKLAVITRLSNEGKTAMVGDGINDAPALARADVGISFGQATTVAVESAQVILLGNSDLSRLKEAYLIATNSLQTIKQNLFWAFFYNVLAIPIAAFGFLSPMVAALAMAFSDVIVIGNSILLRSKKLF
jgi:P-type Cu+ transporter